MTADEWSAMVDRDVPLAPMTSLKVGGAAKMLAKPQSTEELAKLVRAAGKDGIAWRVLGGGSNVLIPDEGFDGLVIRLDAPTFCDVKVDGERVHAGGGAMLADLIADACKAGLTGLETLVGIPGTVAGALRHNASNRGGDIGQFVHAIEMMDRDGNVQTRLRADLRFGYRSSNIEGIVLSADFELERDDPAQIVQRVRKLWMSKHAQQPFGPQATAYAFRNPRGHSAVELIEKSGMSQFRSGGAELSSADPRYVVAHPGSTSRDVRRLIELVRENVEKSTGVTLELQIDLW